MSGDYQGERGRKRAETVCAAHPFLGGKIVLHHKLGLLCDTV